MTRKRIGLIIGALLALLLLSHFLMPVRSMGFVRLPQGVILQKATRTDDQPCVTYHYAVVTCGVHSIQRFHEAQLDPVVRAEYGGITPVAMGVLAAAKPMYVRYRIGDRTYTTNYRVRLPKDEPVLIGFNKSRGKLVFVRERCGNLLFETKQPEEEMAAVQPAPSDLEEIDPGSREDGASPASSAPAAEFSFPDTQALNTGTALISDGMFLAPAPAGRPESAGFGANYAGGAEEPASIGPGTPLASAGVGKVKDPLDNRIDVTALPDAIAAPEPGSLALAFIGCAFALLLLLKARASSR